MRHIATSILIMVLVLSMSACGSTEDPSQDDSPLTNIEYDTDDNEPLSFADDSRELIDTDSLANAHIVDFPSASFENAVREALDLKGDILYSEIKAVKELKLFASVSNITSIAGIEYFESLEYLYLSENPHLTSINGVQELSSLRTLQITNTSVKTIDYAFDNLVRLEASSTLVDMDGETFTQFTEASPTLTQIGLKHTPTTLDHDLVEAVKAWRDSQTIQWDGQLERTVHVDYLQVDLDSIDYDAIIRMDRGFFDRVSRWYFSMMEKAIGFNNKPDWNVEGFRFDTIMRGETFRSIFTNERPERINFNDDEHLFALEEAIEHFLKVADVGRTDDGLAKMLLVYHHFLATISIDNDGSEAILDALNGVDVTEDAAYDTLALLNRQIGITAYENGYLVYNNETQDLKKQPLMTVLYDHHQYAIIFDDSHDYELFMVGQGNTKRYLENRFDEQRLNMAHWLKAYAPNDLPRSLIEAAACEVGFNLEYEN